MGNMGMAVSEHADKIERMGKTSVNNYMKFRLGRREDKYIEILGPDNVLLELDYDDVNHYEIDEFIPLILEALNTIPEFHWRKAIERANIKFQSGDDYYE